MHLRDVTSSPTPLTISVRPFARYAEVLGSEELTIELPEASTVQDAIRVLREQAPNGHMLPETPLVAIELEQVARGRLLADGEQIALLPPLAGG